MQINLALFCLVILIISGCAEQAPAPIEYNYNKSYTKNSSEIILSSKENYQNGKIIENNEEEIINSPIPQEETSFIPTTGYLQVPNVKHTLAQEDTIIVPQIPLDNRKVIYHQVQAGETLASIANDYGQTIEELENLNNISRSYVLQESQLIKIKTSMELLNKKNKENSLKNTEKNFSQSKAPDAILLTNTKFIKPIEGKIITRFGDPTPTGENKGINIAANEGSVVQSIASGRVAFAGHHKKFGNLLIIKLDQGDLYAAYAHLGDLILTKGALVTQGEIIGHVGHTGEVKFPQLHFAIREGKIAIDPLKYFKY